MVSFYLLCSCFPVQQRGSISGESLSSNDVVVLSVIRIVERVHTRLICVSCFDCMRMKVKTTHLDKQWSTISQSMSSINNLILKLIFNKLDLFSPERAFWLEWVLRL